MPKRISKTIAPIPDELSAPVSPTETIAMISPNGEPIQIPASQAETWAGLGYKQSTPELSAAQAEQSQYGEGIVNELEAGGLGILRGASLGMSDLALRKINPEWADSAAKIKQYNPDASLAGELASFALPMLGGIKALGAAGKAAKSAGLLQGLVSSGGESLGKVATKIVGENLAGHAAGSAVNMAAQSAVYQAAHNLSEDALGDKDLTAESILANTGQAAILGAGLGAAIPVASRAAQSVVESTPVRYLVSGSAKQFAKFFDPDRSLQLFTGAMKKELGAETGKRFQTAVNELANDSGESLYSSGELALDPITAKIVKTGPGGMPNQQAAYERVQSLQKQAGNVIGDTLKEADQVAQQSGIQFSNDTKWWARDAQAMSDKLEKWRTTAQITDGEANRLAATVNDIGAKITSKEGNLSALHDMRRGLDQRIGGKNWEQLGGEEIEVIKDMRRAVSQKIDQGFTELADAKLVPLDALERWKKLNRLASNLYTIEKPLETAIARSEANVNVGGLRFRDLGIGAIGAGVLGPAGAALGVANKVLQTDTGLLARAAIGEKIQKLAWAEQLIKKSQSEIADSVKSFLGGATSKIASEGVSRFGAPVAYALSKTMKPDGRAKSQQDWFNDTRKQILLVASNPEQFAAQQGKESQALADAAPGVTDAVIGKQLQVYTYLANTMPKNPGMPTNITADTWKPADYEVQRFRKVVQVARQPLSILQDLHNGTLTAQQVDAVKTLYPKLYDNILAQVRNEVASPDMKTTYQQRLKLGQLFQGTEPTMDPAFVAAMQTPAAKPEEQSGKMRPPGGSVKLSKNIQTSTERTASR